MSAADWRKRDATRVWSSEKHGPCKHCGGNHLHSYCRRLQRAPELITIPIGRLCPTAALLKTAGVRRNASPLDWCITTLQLWRHILTDKGAALSSPAQVCHDGDGKPFHAMYCEPEFPRVQIWIHGYHAPT